MPLAADVRRCRAFGQRRSLARLLSRCTSFAAALLVFFAVVLSRPVGAQEWHELYSDGQQALRAGKAQQAVQLLRRAIQKRPLPGISVPTYGTNSEPQYFPYLRLADAYLQLEAYDEVLKVLETSAKFGVEPAPERSALESRAKAALIASRPPPPPSQVAARESTASPPVVVPPASTIAATIPAPKIEAPVASPLATAKPTSPPITSARPDAAVRAGPVLEVTTEPPGAQVFVDDEAIGRSDPQTGRLRVTTLRPGKHRIRLSAPDRDDVTRDIVLLDGPVTFHGVLAVRPKPTPDAPVGAPANPRVEPRSSRPSPWWALGLLPLVLIPSLWVWRRARARNEPPRTPQPMKHATPVSPRTEEGSYDHFPVDFGEYQLIKRIGKGGMASVYEAVRRGETFALKRPLSGFLDDPRLLERFAHEAELGRALHHPNIVRITDRGQVGSIPFFAMELIDGETLRDRLDREGRLDPVLATSVTAHVAEALDYAHHKGVIHRDLKPTNIMLERSGGLKVMDYGVARARFQEGLTTAGGFIGTPHYAAPEAMDGRTEPRSDLYSLGIVFFEMLTGALPFPGDNPYAVLRGHRETPPPTPSSLNYAVSEELDRIVIRLLSKESADRPTAEELLNQLTDYQETLR